MAVKARMKVQSITAQPTYVSVGLAAVYSSDPDDPNYSFSQATPAASLSMTITNPDAFAEFNEGDTFDLTFEKHTPVKSA